MLEKAYNTGILLATLAFRLGASFVFFDWVHEIKVLLIHLALFYDGTGVLTPVNRARKPVSDFDELISLLL